MDLIDHSDFNEVEFTYEKFPKAKVDLYIPTFCGLSEWEILSTKVTN